VGKRAEKSLYHQINPPQHMSLPISSCKMIKGMDQGSAIW